jgi:hypothetical protein
MGSSTAASRPLATAGKPRFPSIRLILSSGSGKSRRGPQLCIGGSNDELSRQTQRLLAPAVPVLPCQQFDTEDGEVLVGLPLSLMLMTAGVRCFGLEFKVSTIDLPRRTVVYVRR